MSVFDAYCTKPGQVTICDGSTDLGTCINAATTRSVRVSDGDFSTSTVIVPKDGQLIEWGVGRYTLAGIICPASLTGFLLSCDLEGVSPYRSILQLADNANRDLVTTANYALLAGSPPCESPWNMTACWGAFGVTIRNLTLDGNSAHNTKGSGYRGYGVGLLMEDDTIQNFADTCLVSNYQGDFGANPWREAQIVDVKEQFCGYDSGTYTVTNVAADGAQILGPHDTYIIRNYSGPVGQFLWNIQTPVFMDDANSDDYSLGAAYVHGSSGPGSNATIRGNGDVFSSDNGFGLFVDHDAQPVSLTNALIYGGNPSTPMASGPCSKNGTSGCAAVTLLVASNIISGQVVQLNPNGTALQLGGYENGTAYPGTVSLDGILQSNGAWFHLCVEGNGLSKVHLTSDNTAGTLNQDGTPTLKFLPGDSVNLLFTPRTSAYGGKGTP